MPSTCLIVLFLLMATAPPLAAQTPLDDRGRQDALRHYSNQHLELANAWLTERRAVGTDDG